MAPLPRSGLFGFLLLLGALLPPAAPAASRTDLAAWPGRAASEAPEAPSAGIEARLRRISAALREQLPAAAADDPQAPEAPAASARGSADKLAFVFVNGPAVGFRNGGFRNGGWGNGGFRNGGWGNGGFRNGGWPNGGWRNGGFLNRW